MIERMRENRQRAGGISNQLSNIGTLRENDISERCDKHGVT